MEMAKREIRLFFVRYGSLLFVLTGIIIGVIMLVQFLNNREKYLIEVSSQSNKNVIITAELNKQKKQLDKLIKEDSKFIEEFVNYCKFKKIAEAYAMLTINCKNTKYKTIQEFKNNFVDKVTENFFDYEIEAQEKEKQYKVIVYNEDILQTGSIKNRKKIEIYCNILEDNNNKKIEIY